MIDVEGMARDLAVDWLRERMWLAEQRERLAAAKPRTAPARRRAPSATAEELHAALLEVPAEVWLPTLTGSEVPRSRHICCPLPRHDDRTPSCRLYETTFYCFGCHRGGDIFCFAGELWGVPTHSRTFPELRERLADRLLGVAA